jgi:predicted transcriptional regulator
MVRKQLYIDDRLDARLSATASATGFSQAEIVRRALEAYFVEPDRAVGAAAMLWEHWQETDRLGLGSAGWKWNRDELYDR